MNDRETKSEIIDMLQKAINDVENGKLKAVPIIGKYSDGEVNGHTQGSGQSLSNDWRS